MSLLEIVRQRVPGQPHPNPDCNAFYIQEIDCLIRTVYYRRYGSLNPDISTFVDFETFANLCWDRLEAGSGLQKLQTLTFSSDQHLRRYLTINFQQILQEMIYQQSPGLETRVRQLRSILKEFCTIKKINFKRFWHLNAWDGTPPANMNTDQEIIKLEATLDQVRPPDATYFRHEDKRHGLEISKGQMDAYLRAIFDLSGGVLSENALIAFIARFYHIVPSVVVEHTDTGADSNSLENMADDTGDDPVEGLIDDGFLVVEMQDAVKQFVGMLTMRQKAIFKLIYADEVNQGAAAKMLAISNATLSNEVKKIHAILMDMVTRNTFQPVEFERFITVCKLAVISSIECTS
ncbi:MAG: hypothetical protein AB7S77_23375 [Desulfatirhabdiaceae bacterium]